MILKRQRHRYLSGLFQSERDLEKVLYSLEEAGFTGNQVKVLMPEDAQKTYFSLKGKRQIPERALWGGLIGGALGSVLGGMALSGEIVTTAPGISVWGAIIGAAVGLALGICLGTLIGAKTPEHQAIFGESNFVEEAGNVVIQVQIPEEEAVKI